jgi:peptidoglycan hydrolase-like protein with peptidoglycan-binding domain
MMTTISRRTVLKGAATVPLAVAATQWLHPTAASAYAWPRTLRSGMSGSDVRELQIRVAGYAAGAPQQTYVKIDGAFGSGTAAAVQRFQQSHGLSADGIAGPRTQAALNALESPDGSTAHFDFGEFTSHDGAGFSGAAGGLSSGTVRENIRQLMYKLEALRRKAGDRPVNVSSGFRSVRYNRSIGGASSSQHCFGIAADVVLSGYSTRSTYRVAETCGFSGLEAYTHSWQHCDSRIEHAYGAQRWWWESGIV